MREPKLENYHGLDNTALQLQQQTYFWHVNRCIGIGRHPNLIQGIQIEEALWHGEGQVGSVEAGGDEEGFATRLRGRAEFLQHFDGAEIYIFERKHVQCMCYAQFN